MTKLCACQVQHIGLSVLERKFGDYVPVAVLAHCVVRQATSHIDGAILFYGGDIKYLRANAYFCSVFWPTTGLFPSYNVEIHKQEHMFDLPWSLIRISLYT